MNLIGDSVQFFLGIGGDGDIERELEEAFDAFDKLFLKDLGVFELGLSGGLGDTAAFDVGADLGFHLGDATAELVEGALDLDGVHEHGDVDTVVEVDQWREPIGGDVAGVAGDKESADVSIADLEEGKIDFNTGRGENILNVNLASDV